MAGRLLVRADADGRIGTGHLMRPLALTAAWHAAGGQATFLGRCPAEKLQQRVRAAGARFVSLQRVHPHPADLSTTLALLEKTSPRWVVLDGYQFDSAYQGAIRAAGGRLLVIDDAAGLEHYHADVVLNQNLAAEGLNYACDPGTTLLLGCRYALLRPEFHAWGAFRRQTPKTARKLLVTLGGSDPHDVTRTVIAALERLELPELEVKIVVGAANPHVALLRKQIRLPSQTPHTTDVELLTDAINMPELMAWADLGLSAAGSTCWELAFMQLPAVVVVSADNQQLVAQRLAEAGAVTNLGRANGFEPEAIAEAIWGLCRDGKRRASQSEAGRRLVDGKGAQRVVAIVDALDGMLPEDQLRLRPAAAGDVLPLWRLANEPTVRGCSFSTDPIPLDEHIAWFGQRLSSPQSRIWVLDFQELILAVVRYDRSEQDTALVSFHVAPAFRRQGLGTRLLEHSRQRARNELGVVRLRAIVREENVASVRTLVKAGFSQIDSGTFKDRACKVFEQTA